jgi:hypothetical protein
MRRNHQIPGAAMKHVSLIVALTLLFLAGCEKQKEPPEAPQPAKPVRSAPATDLTAVSLLKSPLEPLLVEHPTQALTLWRQYRGERPALVLISGDPFLQPLPEALQREAVEAIDSASADELRGRLAYPAADPLLLPAMALSAALRAGLFSEVVWILPLEAENNKLDVDTFRRQLLGYGAVSEKEAESFTLGEGVLSGTVRGVPFRAAHPGSLPPLDAPVLLHIDLSYFAPLYKGEIKTPLYPLVKQSFARLRQSGWKAFAATISRSNLDALIPLPSRFLGDDLAALLADPSRLDAPLPENSARRANALYLENFFQKEKIRDLYLEMEQADPEDPSVKYALYEVARQFKEGDKALRYLAEAAALDPAYALEYLSLADLATEKKLQHEALRMLQLAAESFPDNPFISLRLADSLRDLGQPEEAGKIIEKLKGLPWSPVYYSDLPDALRNWPSPADPAAKSEKKGT